jgi:biotin-(acetyl-CoA carboxylase) ligase
MTEAARLAVLGCASGTIAGAEEQISGQGRFGRTWHSEREAGLYISFVLRLDLPEESVRVLSMSLGLAAADAIARATGTTCDIRWPNDLLIGDKKCAGILVQVERDCFVAGIGNKYKSEILWQLGLDPFMRTSALAPREVTRLLAEIPATLQRGYLQAGRTRPLQEGESAASWNHKHWVFRRGSRPCWRCGTPIVTDRARSARVTFLCPTCQPARAITARSAPRTRRPSPSSRLDGGTSR